MPRKERSTRSVPYRETLNSLQTATAIQAARLNALDLLDTAEILCDLKRYSHSEALSILAIEEASKVALLQMVFLGFGKQSDLWRYYRTHKAKTELLNPGIEARIRAEFPEFPSEFAKATGDLGPTSEELELAKQRAIYSDCLKIDNDLVVHLPRNTDRRQPASDRLFEARALVHTLRDYSPEELEIWLKHAKKVQRNKGGFADMLEPLHKELLAKGFVKEGAWNTILADNVPRKNPKSAT